MMLRRTIGLFAMALFAMVATASAAPGPAVTDPAKAGPDFEIQGEYSGELTMDGSKGKFGVQVIALDDGKFDAVLYHGGLPGAGWDRSMKRQKASGTREGDEATLSGDGWAASIADGQMQVTNSGGDALGSLKKVDRKSPTLGDEAPDGALVLFDGTSNENFPGAPVTEEGYLGVAATSKQKFHDHTLHIEFRTPYMPQARGQGRGNSGVYIQSRYECQVLDSFGLEGKDNECGGIYKIAQPRVNMCFPPLSWQTYDIDFKAAEYDGKKKKVKNARVTIRHNGVVIHEDLELPNATPGRAQEGPEPMPVFLQNHGNPVVYKNIWVIQK